MARASAWTLAAAASAAIGLTALAGCAETTENANSAGSQGAARTAPRCFRAADARNFRSVNATTVNLRVGRRDFYRIDLLGPCPDLNFSMRMGLQTSAGSQVCTGSGIGTSIVVPGTRGPTRCPVRQITALTPEEVAALQPRHRP
jgi:hypothetical protein